MKSPSKPNKRAASSKKKSTSSEPKSAVGAGTPRASSAQSSATKKKPAPPKNAKGKAKASEPKTAAKKPVAPTKAKAKPKAVEPKKAKPNSKTAAPETHALASELRKEHVAVLRAAEAAREEARRRAEALEAELARVRAEATKATAEAERQLVEARAGAVELGSRLETTTAIERAKEAEVEQHKLAALRARVALGELQTRLDQARHQLREAHEEVVRTRSTLSFQLGHALIFGFKSREGLRALPRRLWELRKEAVRRKERRFGGGPKDSLPAPTPIAYTFAGAAPEPARPAAKLSLVPGREGFASRLETLKVAAITDEFTYGSYRDECNLLQLTPQYWEQELEHFRPELLFIESAWRGKDDLWGNKVGHRSQEVQGIVAWCRERGVPTVFWNKEDPIHFETFLNTAMLFDYVFTTDLDCVSRYKAALGHDRVYVLAFACQPRVHNPIEAYDRKDVFCFAGAYYARYPERTRDLGNFAATLPSFRPLEIYDRNFGKSDPSYQFPPEYQPFIVGSLPFDQIDKAYKGYRYAINLNSIKQSQSMFARRVYELLACNTVTVSNYSRGLRLLFGDLVLASDSGAEILRRLRERTEGADDLDKLRLRALRKVMSEHTYQDRLAYVVEKVRGVPSEPLLPRMHVLAYARSDAQVRAVESSFERQRYAQKALTLVVRGGFSPSVVPAGARLVHAPEAEAMTLAGLGEPGDWLAVMVPEDYYGPHYLTDLALATRYAEGPVVGKVAHYGLAPEQGLELRNAGREYRVVGEVPARMGAVRLDHAEGNVRDFVRTLYTAKHVHERALAIDRFNYCAHGAEAGDEVLARVDDEAQGLDEGRSLTSLVALAEAVTPEERSQLSFPRLTGADLASLLASPKGTQVQVAADGASLRIDSALADDKHEYWYVRRDQRPEELGAANGKLRFHLEVTPGLNIQFTVIFLDAKGQRIGHVVRPAGRNVEVEFPTETDRVRLGLRFYSSGHAEVRALVLGHLVLEPREIITRGEHLVLTNHYPSYDDLYRNAFVHRRVIEYRARGEKVDVFRLRRDSRLGFHEFEGIECITGSAETLENLLSNGAYRTVLVHFLDEVMWSVLARHLDRLKVIVWVHGAEIQPFYRREFNYNSESERSRAIAQSEVRMRFWRDLLRVMPQNLQMVFVSRTFAAEVMDDLGLRLLEGSYKVVHNPIDTDVFRYERKPSSQRTKVLSIRTYASPKYANDLTTKAILHLSTRPDFDKFEFRLVGDGPLFEELNAPLRKFANVQLEQRFLTHQEMQHLYASYGVFLNPTRWDSQGVSRDEAMASGLVPITNAVAAIPEFVDDDCGMLVPPEDWRAMADAMVRLAEDEALFLRLSENAAKRVRRQSAFDTIIARELALFEGEPSEPALPRASEG